MDNIPDEEVEGLTVGEAKKTGKGLSGKLKVPLIILLILLLGAAAAWWFLLKHGPAEELAEKDETPQDEPPPFGEVYFIRDIIINPSGGRRVFMVSLGLEYFDAEVSAELGKRESLLRDNLITLFSSQPQEILTNIKYRRALRARVQKIMDYQLGEGAVTRVFFEKWVFQ